MTGAPLPLPDDQALQRAVEMRERGLSWAGVAIVLGDYHGVWFSPSTWRRKCFRRVTPRPPGRPLGSDRVTV